MRSYAAAFLTLALASPASCQIVSDPPKVVIAQDVEFLRGCWADKDDKGERVFALLRLLPEGASGPAYQGYLQSVTPYQTKAQLYLSFTRDGATATQRDPEGRPGPLASGAPWQHAPLPEVLASHLPPAKHRAVFAFDATNPGSAWLIADGDGDTLKIYRAYGTGGFMNDWFKGERDGCD